MYNYKGSGSDIGVYFWYDMLLSYNVPITGHYWMDIVNGANKGIFCNNVKSDAIVNNNLTNVYREVTSLSNRLTITANETPVGDFWQNNIFLDIAAGYNQNTVHFQISYDNMTTSVNLNNAVHKSSGSFPVVINTLPFYVLNYLNATTLVESNNASIKSTAQSITAGCTDLRDAVIKLCQWIEAYIKEVNTNPQPSNQSSIVFSTKTADCDGAAHLLAAFCRSLHIPARIVCGYIINHSVSYPTNTGTITLGNGNGTIVTGHAACEIYIPYLDAWVRCDPAQRTTLFGPQQFIKIATGMDSNDLLTYGCSVNIHYNQAVAPQITQISLNPSVYTNNNNIASFQYVNSEIFMSNYNTVGNFGLLCAFDPSVTNGFYDEVKIQNQDVGTTLPWGCSLSDNAFLLTENSSAHFYAIFTSGSTPVTYPVGFDWSIVLFTADGEEYTYAQQDGLPSLLINYNSEGCCWVTNVGILPSYDWLYDPSGNIYGKVRVTVHISDGDTKYDEADIGVIPPCIVYFSNQTVNTNTAVNGCIDLNIQNVNVTNNAKLKLNAPDEVIIDSNFEVKLGSKLEIK